MTDAPDTTPGHTSGGRFISRWNIYKADHWWWATDHNVTYRFRTWSEAMHCVTGVPEPVPVDPSFYGSEPWYFLTLDRETYLAHRQNPGTIIS